MKKPILVVMAAGLGSRFGGLKQMAPLGLHGESLIDYTLYDALEVGFERVIFIVNHKIHEDFRDIVGKHVEDKMEVRYAFQELDMLPEGFSVPADRVKPWGTAHAILCAAPMIDAPFCALNGDDLYGRHALKEIYDYLAQQPESDAYAMVGYELTKTLSDHGYVSRGECQLTDDGYLKHIIERTHIIPSMDGPLFTMDNETYHRLPDDTMVSMNIWALTPAFLDELKAGFVPFLQDALKTNPLKAENYLPNVIGGLLAAGKVTVKVMRTTDSWLGVTNASDAPLVKAELARLTQEGMYPNGLWLKR